MGVRRSKFNSHLLSVENMLFNILISFTVNIQKILIFFFIEEMDLLITEWGVD